jgi:hypothetical protein
MTTAPSVDDLSARTICAAHDLLNIASGANSAAKRAIRREDRTQAGVYAALYRRLLVLCLKLEAFTEIHGEFLHDLGQQGLLDHLHMQRGALGAALPLIQVLIKS